MRCNDPQLEWRIADVERTANENKSRLYELDSLRSDLGNLEHTLREVSSENSSLRYELETLRNEIETLKVDMQEEGI